ncbi:helix-turn-helix domain-containing protein [Streptomyces sp. NPDC047072]|uniref:helix-turn-helix domain-containing protein n=1 Tax=Streptomyces sp. NPDC047072 TaxID=3154809 RepID=UPI0033E481EE
MTPEQEFAEALRLRRKAAGLSLGELSRRVNYSKSYLSRVENGGRQPGPALARECDTALHAEGELLALLGNRGEPGAGAGRGRRGRGAGQGEGGRGVPGGPAGRGVPGGPADQGVPGGPAGQGVPGDPAGQGVPGGPAGQGGSRGPGGSGDVGGARGSGPAGAGGSALAGPRGSGPVGAGASVPAGPRSPAATHRPRTSVGPARAGSVGRGAHPARLPLFGAEFEQLVRRGDARHLLGDMYEAGRLYLEAYRAAEGDELARAHAVVRCARRWSDPGQVDRDLLARIDESLRALHGRDDLPAVELRLRLTAHRAKKLSMGVGDDTAVPGAEPATGADRARGILRELRERLPDVTPETHCEVLTECRWALYDFAPAGELLALSAELRDVATRSRSMYFVGEALVALAIDQLRMGRVPAADATIRRHREHAAHRHSTLARWQQHTLDALINLWQGEFAAAEGWIFGRGRELADAMEADLAVPADTLSQTCLGQAYWLRHEQGRMAELFGSPLMSGVRRRDYFPVWRAGLALALCETGRHDQAADQILAFAADTHGFTAFPPSGWALPTAAVLAQAYAELAEHADQQANDTDGMGSGAPSGTPPGPEPGSRLAELLPYVPPLRALLDAHPGELVLAGWPTVLLGPAARFSALLALVAGEPETALGQLRRAVRLAQHSPAQMARLRLDEARVRLRSPDIAVRLPAQDLARTALRIAEELGMAGVAEDCREFLQAAAEGPFTSPAGP